MTTIGIKAFYNCSSLTSITIGRSVTSIGYQAFEGCNEITNVRFACEYVDNWFSGYNKINEIVIGNNVKEIGAKAFYSCNGLASVKIGSGVREIGEKAFASCPELSDVYCYKENPPYANYDAFEGSYVEYATLYVPKPSIYLYNNWIWSGNIKALEIESNIHKLIYMIDGEVYKTYEIEEGETITPEPTPTKGGYTFSGWSEILKTMPAHDVTVTGTFSINSYKLTYMIDDKVYKEKMYEYGATITPEPQPEGDYATFEWTDLPETMPAHDVVVHASYTSGIVELLMNKQQDVRIYSPNGYRLNASQKGMNIIRMNDGKSKKVIIK